MGMKETQRRVIEQRIAGAGADETRLINLFRQGFSEKGLRQAPGIGELAGLLRGISLSPTGQDLSLARQATYGGIAEGLRPQLGMALQQAAEMGAARGIPSSTLAAALQAQAVPQIMAPALMQAGQQYAGLLTQLPFQRAGFQMNQAQALSGVRSQAFGEAQAALARDLQERSMSQTSTERMYQKSTPMWKKILGGAVGALAGGFLGPLGGMAASALFGGGGGGNAPLTTQLGQAALGQGAYSTSSLMQGGQPTAQQRARWSSSLQIPSAAAPVPLNMG